MTLKTLIATAAVALAFAPSAHAAAVVEAPTATPVSAQQAKWKAYDAAVRTAYATPARPVPAPASTDDGIPTAGRIALVMVVMFAGAGIFFIRRRDAMRTAAAGGWDM